MTKIDDILERLKGQQPIISDPDELTGRIMDNLPSLDGEKPEQKPIPTFWWWAAVMLLLMGIGAVVWLYRPQDDHYQPVAQEYNKKMPIHSPTMPDDDQSEETHSSPITDNTQRGSKKYTKVQTGQQRQIHTLQTQPQSNSTPNDSLQLVETIVNDSVPNGNDEDEDITYPIIIHPPVAIHQDLHYVTHEMPSDSDYVDPSLIDDFVMKFANYYQVETVTLDCDLDTSNTDIVHLVRVFPDTKEVDVFGRMLKVAISIDTHTPGYHLNFSQQQFYFILNDERKGLRYLWLAERVNGQILLYSNHSPIDSETSSECYQEFRKLIIHTLPTSTM